MIKEKGSMNIRKDTAGCLSTLLFFGIIFYIMNHSADEFKVLLAAIVTIFILVIWRKFQRKKEALIEEQAERWPLEHLDKIEQSLSEELSLVKKSFEQLQTIQPPIQNFIIYQDLEERYNYLLTCEKRICSIYNEKIAFLGTVENYADIEKEIKQVTSPLLQLNPKNYNVFLITAFKKLLEKYGVDFDGLLKHLHRLEDEVETFSNTTLKEINRERTIMKRGIEGERKLQEELDLYYDIFKALYNVRIETEGISVESDAVIVSPKGVFSIEAKNFGSSGQYNIKITKDGQWQKVKDGQTEPMKDVASQVNRHIGFKQRFLNHELKKRGFTSRYIYIEPIIVIANDVATIENESSQVIIRASQVYQLIKSKPDILNTEEIEVITSIFAENKQPAKKYPHTDYVKKFENWCQHATPLVQLAKETNQALQTYLQICK